MEELKLARIKEEAEEQPIVEDLREDILIAALEYAYRARGTRHEMTHEEAKAKLYKRRGWS